MWAKEKKAAWSKVYNPERRAWYKSRGICVACGEREARIERTLCAEYAKKQKQRSNKCDPGRKRSTEHTRQRRARFYALGLCTNCGKRPYRPGKKTCEYCAKQQRDRDMDRRVRKRLNRQIEEERNRLIEAEHARRASNGLFGIPV